jgi:hypothetical protein
VECLACETEVLGENLLQVRLVDHKSHRCDPGPKLGCPQGIQRLTTLPSSSYVTTALCRGADKSLVFPISPRNNFITSKFIDRYMFDQDFIIVTICFNVYCMSEVKTPKNNGECKRVPNGGEISFPERDHKQTKQTPWPLVRERTVPTERPPLVDEI